MYNYSVQREQGEGKWARLVRLYTVVAFVAIVEFLIIKILYATYSIHSFLH